MKPAAHRASLLAGASACLLALASLQAPAAAQAVTTVDLTPDFNAVVSVTGTNPGNGLTTILEQARVLDALATSDATADAIVLTLPALIGAGTVATVSGDSIVADGAINTGEQIIGLFGSGAATDGAAIATTMISLRNSLQALAVDNVIGLDADFADSGTLNASVTGNSIESSAIFNAGFNLIESVVPLELAVPTDGAIYDATGTIELDASASLSIVSTQLSNSLSGQEWQPPVGDPVLATAVTQDADITLNVTAPAGESFSGALDLSNNSIAATTRGQVSQSAIVLHDEIATLAGPVIGAGAFQGSALIYGLQNSDDVADPDGDFLGQGLNSYVTQSEIVATVENGDATSAPGALALVSLAQDDNSIIALSRANEASNEIAFDPALSLVGPFDGLSLVEGEAEVADLLDPDLDEEVVFFFEREGDRDAVADYLIVSRQSMNRRDEVDPVVIADVSDSRIAAELSTASANSAVSLAGNSVQALAEGNAGTHAIHNGETVALAAPLIDAVAAIVNWQWITAPNVVASLTPPDGEAAISLDVTLLGPGEDAPDGILSAGSFAVEGNVASARANGNRGAALIAFEATEMALSLASEVPAGSTTQSQAHLDSDRGATNDGDSFTASAGATLANFQVLDSADPSHAGDDFLAPGLAATTENVSISASLALDPAALATGLSTLGLALDGNTVESRAEGNAFDGVVSLSSLTSWSGSAGGLSTQIDNDQSVETRTLDSDIAVEITVDAGLGSLETADLSLFGNRLLAVGTANRESQSIVIDATAIEGADWRADYDPASPQSSLSAVVEGYAFTPFRVTRHRSTANGSVALLSDQTADDTGVLAELAGGGISFVIEADSVARVSIEAGANVIAAQARVNDAVNTISLDAAAVLRNGGGETAGIELPPGPLATIVAFQGSGRGEIDDQLPGQLTDVVATLSDSNIEIVLPELTEGGLSADGNMLTASAAANVADNLIEAEAVAIVAGLGDAEPFSDISFNAGNVDYDYSMLASFSILSSQRNESQQFDGEPRGPGVFATLENPDGEAAVELTLQNGLETGHVSLDGTVSQAVARGNVANNEISLRAVTIEGSAHILSRQGNDGDVVATNTNGGVSLVLNDAGGGAVSAGEVSMDGNTVQATAIGNAVFNQVGAEASGAFVGAGVGEPAVIDADLPIDGEVNVSANLSILNSQFNGGTEGSTQEISATVNNGLIALNVNGATSASQINSLDNRVDATAIGNFASNTVSSLSSGGDHPSASVYNRQLNEFTNQTATVNGGGVSLVTTGPISASQINMTSTVSATAIGNSAVITMSSRTGAP
jgi:hypothetical protein